MYGHFRSKTQMKSVPGRYWQENPTPGIQTEVERLNAPDLDAASRLRLLRTGSVGGILVVTRLYDSTGPTTVPFLTILAAPAVTTYDETSVDQGVILEDLWDDSALAGFDPTLDAPGTNCPVLAAQEGFSRDPTLTSNIESLLVDAQPLLIPEGQKLGGIVTLDDESYPLPFLLPEVCNFPLGMRWPLDISFLDLATSIRVALGKTYAPFQTVLQVLQPRLEPWLLAISAHPTRFQVSSCRFLPVYDAHFPNMDTGLWPASTSDPESFLPSLTCLMPSSGACGAIDSFPLPRSPTASISKRI
jgi:hypothetical protein